VFSQPGRGDLILAEFQAKLAAGENPHPDPAEERMERINRVVFRFGLLVTAVAALLGWVFDVNVAAVGSIVLVAVAVLLTWRFRRRQKAQVASVSDQP
jgi:hypothetical protein